MSDQNPNAHPDQGIPSGIPLIPGPLTPEEKLAQEREQDRKAKEQSDTAFQERQVQAVESANNIAARNTLLTGIACLISAVTLGGTLYQAHVNNRVLQNAQATLSQMKTDSGTSSRQFQVQLGHYDAGLGVTQMLAQHAGEQSISADTTAHAAQGSLGVAQRSLDVSNRPWIDATITQKSALTFGPSGAGVNVAFQLRDVGHTPAIHTLYHASIVYLPQKTWHMVEVKEAERQECSSFPRHFFAGSPTLVPTIFPGQDPPQVPDWPATITASEIQAALSVRGKVPGPPGEVELILVACVSYQDSYRARVRHSAYGFALGIPEGGVYMAYITPKGTYDNVRLVYLDSFAD